MFKLIKRLLKWLATGFVALIAAAFMLNYLLAANVDSTPMSSDHYSDGQFHNTVPNEQRFRFSRLIRFAKRAFTEEPIDNTPDKPLPMQTLSRGQLSALDDQHIYLVKLGHSSMLMKVYGRYWLLDPVFSNRASPFSFIGPQRFQPPPIQIEDLPDIDKVLISHNHYDHLDKDTIRKLTAKTQQFLVPMGVEGDLQHWGVDPQKIKRFDWWQEYPTDNALIAFTPTRHFSGRAATDRNKTLWGSWVIKAGGKSLFFNGDSGYFDGFKTIGDKYGPFDLTMIETGAYNPDWADIHMFPEESVQAHIDLRGKTMLPIHNSTFDLSFHPWYDPLERAQAAAKKRGVALKTPLVGEVFSLDEPVVEQTWWKG